MYKARLRLWGFYKNISKRDWQNFAIMRSQREAIGKPFSRVEMHGKIKSEHDFRKYLQLHKFSEAAFVREALALTTREPCLFQYRDPPPPLGEPLPTAGSISQPPIHADQIRQAQADIHTCSTTPSTCYNTGSPRDASSYPPVIGSAFSSTRQETTYLSNDRYHSAAASSSTMIDQSEQDNVFRFRGEYPFHGDVSIQGAATHKFGPGILEYTGPIHPDLPDAIPVDPYEMVLPRYLSQVIEPEAGVMPVGPPYSEFGGMLGQILKPGSMDIADMKATDGADGHRAFMTDTIMACISAESKEFSICGKWIENANLGLGRMCNSRDRLLLVTLSTALVWLEVHDEGDTDGSIGIAEALMREFSQVANHTLGPDDAICVILQWMTAAAGKKLATCPIDSERLQQVWTSCRDVLGWQHPNTIVALYCLSHHLITVDKKYAEAEAHLRRAHEAAMNIFGVSHLQSLNILATLSRAQLRQGDLFGASETMQRCIEHEPLGQNHPHRLMLQQRMAIIYKRRGMLEAAEDLYWIVVEGRAATLGPKHKATKTACERLARILQDAGKWESTQDKLEKILSDPQVAVSAYENWWYRMVKHGQNTQVPRAMSEEMEY